MKRFHSRSRQQGMTLVVGLILLVILTMVSVLGFRNVTMSERMAGNAADRNVAFQAAESVGKEALTTIENVLTGAGTMPATGYYDHTATVPPMSTVMAIQGGSTVYWTQGVSAPVSPGACATAAAFDWASCSASVSSVYASNAAAGRYVIELISTSAAGGSTTRVYRVTTRSTGGSGQAEVVLQTLYTKVTTP
uniref:pilus assembly PilX family protein n=1 Tax=Hylemonella sp. TaxID=2066020 RepID=UPI0035B2C2EC